MRGQPAPHPRAEPTVCDEETLAMLLDGRLSGPARERVLEHLSRSDEDRPVFSDAAAILRETEEEDAASRRNVVHPEHPMPSYPEDRREAEHQLRLSLKRALRKRRATQLEHETGLTMQTVRRFITGESVPQKKTMAMLWLWAYKFGDGNAKERAEGELQAVGVSPPGARQMGL